MLEPWAEHIFSLKWHTLPAPSISISVSLCFFVLNVYCFLHVYEGSSRILYYSSYRGRVERRENGRTASGCANMEKLTILRNWLGLGL
jgi:hypothetical protein